MKLPIERIGGKIRSLRKKQAQTLEDLSQSTGLSKGLLSQVERGISQPSLETLWKITKALDTSIVHFFEDVAHTQVHLVRKEDRSQILFPGTTGTCYVLGHTDNSRLRMLEIVLKPGEKMKDQFLNREGEQCLVVTRGELTLSVGEEEYDLHEGDSLFFDSTLAHTASNDGNDTVTYIWSVTPSKFS
ncbi:helix-turn-helix domain-containing protein [Ammoniphilus sp. CFH 90114]|uniref:helix-turn-helix domain-containing protein n=1 Tax=Ammoniphilus sp. CFH 90114 TaxID=2493665 RepID=UPI00100EB82B|nr:XRE family transcriptional regulator [Ammoniphilus sp. CFH 90114]RXT14994.1 XRE family transcriptional regulator [Ammoniphilus sp. CFH 90114]